jgi:hypothetical protein
MVSLKFSLLLFFPHSFSFHSIFQFQLVYQSCPVESFLPQPVSEGFVEIKTASEGSQEQWKKFVRDGEESLKYCW